MVFSRRSCPGYGPLPPWVWPRAAYVHVPFCAHHCGYCDFAVAVGQDHLMKGYLDALAAELATLRGPQEIRTLFIGGGTPTYLDARSLDRLLKDVTPLAAPGSRIRVHHRGQSRHLGRRQGCGPGGARRQPGQPGAQSFHPQPSPNPGAGPRAGGRCPGCRAGQTTAGPGLHGPDLWRPRSNSWTNGTPIYKGAWHCNPDHLSTYGLTYEKGTRLWKQRRGGEVQALNEEAELALYLHAMDTLEGAGFDQYEISSFARPGRRCRHNQVYWANEAYFGFGVGAARYIQGRRELNTRDLQTYLRRTLAGEPAVFQAETEPGGSGPGNPGPAMAPGRGSQSVCFSAPGGV